MNRKTLLITIGIALVVLALGFMAGKAVASTGCFTDTNGNWAEIYICWLYDNGISSGYGDGTYRPANNVTRAEMSKFLRLQAEVPPSTGLIAISEGYGNWMPLNTVDNNLDLFYSRGETQLVKDFPGVYTVSLHPSIPTVFYGYSLQFVGVEFCYSASTYVYLTTFEINVPYHGSVPGNQGLKLTDLMDYYDSSCHYYTLPTPVTLTIAHAINVFVSIYWNNGGMSFDIGRTTFYFYPTSTKAALPASMENAIVLNEDELEADVP